MNGSPNPPTETDSSKVSPGMWAELVLYTAAVLAFIWGVTSEQAAQFAAFFVAVAFLGGGAIETARRRTRTERGNLSS